LVLSDFSFYRDFDDIDAATPVPREKRERI
jgi:hypothetical protein